MMHRAILISFAGVIALPGSAYGSGQTQASDESPTTVIFSQDGQTADVGAGRVGQRQSRAEVSVEAGVTPMARISGRISNRIQSRIRNRVDRNYVPMADQQSSFNSAADELRSSSRPRL